MNKENISDISLFLNIGYRHSTCKVQLISKYTVANAANAQFQTLAADIGLILLHLSR